MKCANCNNEIQEGIKFCGVCGTPVKQDKEQESPFVNDVNRKTNYKKMIVIGSILIVVIITAIYFLVVLPNKHQNILWENVQQRNNVEAFEYYMAEYPKGKNYNEAQIKRNNLIEEDKRKQEAVKQKQEQVLKEKAKNEKHDNLLKYYDIEDIGIIDDPDGYTNVREYSNKNSKVIITVKEKEEFKIIDKTRDWWKIITKDGIIGYMHKSRINIIKEKVNGMFPEASTHKLTEGQLSLWNSEELRLMRNEIFARYGYVFKSKDLQEYFYNQDWYRNIEKLPADNDGSSLLTEIEKANITNILEIENRKRIDEEKKYWYSAKQTNTKTSLIDYLNMYPNGSHWADANRLLIRKNDVEGVKLEIGLFPIEPDACVPRIPSVLRPNEEVSFQILVSDWSLKGIMLELVVRDKNYNVVNQKTVEYNGSCQGGNLGENSKLQKGDYILELQYKSCILDRTPFHAE